MKSRDVLRVLDVTRPTLTKYVKTGIVKVTIKPNGQLHCYSMKLYSKRKLQKIKEAFESKD